ncbi:hypothetical protein C4546_01315 [Candidatus Parcubacteria bacterium]|nr:MAG: hypothetical protein C4546_01315 [Candidatus Parcubacteria bacterium]
MENSKKETSEWLSAGLGIGAAILIMLVYWAFRAVTKLPDEYAWLLIGIIGLMAGLVKVWYENLNAALSFLAGNSALLLLLLSWNLGYSVGWYHALTADAALIIGQLIKVWAKKPTG